MTYLFGVGALYAHQERAPPRNNVLRCFPPPRHTCFGHPLRISEIHDHECGGSRISLQLATFILTFLISCLRWVATACPPKWMWQYRRSGRRLWK